MTSAIAEHRHGYRPAAVWQRHIAQCAASGSRDDIDLEAGGSAAITMSDGSSGCDIAQCAAWNVAIGVGRALASHFSGGCMDQVCHTLATRASGGVLSSASYRPDRESWADDSSRSFLPSRPLGGNGLHWLTPS